MSAAQTNFKEDRLLQVLVAPHVSEKTTRLAEHKNTQVSFKVLPDATKAEIKAAIELIWKDVQVQAVTTLVCKGKEKRSGRTIGRRKDWKKAHITLAEGQDIDFENIG